MNGQEKRRAKARYTNLQRAIIYMANALGALSKISMGEDPEGKARPIYDEMNALAKRLNEIQTEYDVLMKPDFWMPKEGVEVGEPPF